MDSSSVAETVMANSRLLLTHATTMNNRPFTSIVSSGGQQPRRTIESLTEALTTFQSILSQHPDDDAHRNLARDNVCMSFGAPLTSADCESAGNESMMTSNSIDVGSGYYLFNHPIVYQTSPVMYSFGSHRNQVDSPPCTSPVPICILVSCTIFNMALLYHLQGLTKGNNRFLAKALKLYESANVLLQRGFNEMCASRPDFIRIEGTYNGSPWDDDGSTNRSGTVLGLLQIASWNNMSQIYYHQGNNELSRLSLQKVALWLGRPRSYGNNQIANELVSQALLNIFLLQKDPQPAAAA